MTSAKLLLYNCFIMLLCSPDNNAVADVFVIIWLPPHPPPCLLSRTSGNCGENNDFSSLWIKEAVVKPFPGRLPLRCRWLEGL